MLRPQTSKQSGLALGVAALILVGWVSQCFGDRCLPTTPSPCAADGVCHPKSDSWGHYTTRWRPWPGEPAGPQPTVAGPNETDAKVEPLPPSVLPKPEEEDLRGPAKDDKKKTAATEEQAAPPVQDDLPEPDDLDIFDPQGSTLPPAAPKMDDAPPALPPSLQRVAQAMNRQQIPTTRVSAAQPKPELQQASWQQPALGLINPASAMVVEPADEELQQAIYYEASDLEE